MDNQTLNTKHYYIIRRVRISPITNNILFLTNKLNSLLLYNFYLDLFVMMMLTD